LFTFDKLTFDLDVFNFPEDLNKCNSKVIDCLGGPAKHNVSILSPRPAGPGSIPSVPKKFDVAGI